jgi:putative DNA primase/helicase
MNSSDTPKEVFSLEAEQAVLGSLMLDNATWSKVSKILTENDFYHAECRLIFCAIKKLAKNNKPFDPLTLAEELKITNELEKIGGEVSLYELEHNTPTADNIIAYAEILKEKSLLRHTILCAEELIKAPKNLPAIISKLQLLEKRDSTKQSKREIPIYRNANEIEIKSIDWLWKGRIARGKLTMIAGDPGLGKSQLTACIAANVTNGGLWPVDKTSVEQGEVIFLNAEDDAGDTIIPRLKAAEANLSKVHILDAANGGNDAQGNIIPLHFNLAKNLDQFENMLTDLKNVSLIIIDPITAYLGGTDSHKMADVRALLAPLAKLAEKYNIAIICVSHLNKDSGKQALLRVTGSLAFVAAARASYIVTKDKNNPNQRLFLPMKNNLGNDQTGYAFSIESKFIDGNIETSHIIWASGTISITADEALDQSNKSEEYTAIEEAEDFLSEILADGERSQQQIELSAKEAGISWKTVMRAKKQLEIVSRKTGFNDGWVWQLPAKMVKITEDDHTESLAIFDENDHLRQNCTQNQTAMCNDCFYFKHDSIGNGQGIGECLNTNILPNQPNSYPLYPYANRSCEKFYSLQKAENKQEI